MQPMYKDICTWQLFEDTLKNSLGEKTLLMHKMYKLIIIKEKQELKSLNTSASSIKYVAKKESVANKLFVANQVFIGNHVFVWKISWKYFGSGQSSICLKDQLTILRHHISERSKDTTLVWASQVFVWKINWQYFGSG